MYVKGHEMFVSRARSRRKRQRLLPLHITRVTLSPHPPLRDSQCHVTYALTTKTMPTSSHIAHISSDAVVGAWPLWNILCEHRTQLLRCEIPLRIRSADHIDRSGFLLCLSAVLLKSTIKTETSFCWGYVNAKNPSHRQWPKSTGHFDGFGRAELRGWVLGVLRRKTSALALKKKHL
ncbi:hypothetical protein CBL_03184 [Carabus blaptoides fortunei]